MTTGWPQPALAQDDCRPLFDWFASKPEARRLVRERAANIRELAMETMTRTTHTDAERAEFEAWARDREYDLTRDPNGGYLYRDAVVAHRAWQARATSGGVPEFSRIAKQTPDYLMDAGEVITVYTFQNKDGRRGAIDCHGFVYWRQDAAAPHVQADALGGVALRATTAAALEEIKL